MGTEVSNDVRFSVNSGMVIEVFHINFCIKILKAELYLNKNNDLIVLIY